MSSTFFLLVHILFVRESLKDFNANEKFISFFSGGFYYHRSLGSSWTIGFFGLDGAACCARRHELLFFTSSSSFLGEVALLLTLIFLHLGTANTSASSWWSIWGFRGHSSFIVDGFHHFWFSFFHRCKSEKKIEINSDQTSNFFDFFHKFNFLRRGRFCLFLKLTLEQFSLHFASKYLLLRHLLENLREIFGS